MPSENIIRALTAYSEARARIGKKTFTQTFSFFSGTRTISIGFSVSRIGLSFRRSKMRFPLCCQAFHKFKLPLTLSKPCCLAAPLTDCGLSRFLLTDYQTCELTNTRLRAYLDRNEEPIAASSGFTYIIPPRSPASMATPACRRCLSARRMSWSALGPTMYPGML